MKKVNTGKFNKIKRKKFDLEELNELIPSTIRKYITKGVKLAKTFLVLKYTKKIAQFREQSKEEECNTAIEHMKSLKAINHVKVAEHLCREVYPEEFPSIEIEQYSLPEEKIMSEIKTDGKYAEQIKEMKEKVSNLVEERAVLHKKDENRRTNGMRAGNKPVKKLGTVSYL